ncbi:MAG: 16S rRNA (guanine(527)-N(7))-methyltransferase RsmG [Ignavibacteria bacterium]|nr:16S rRNA (guanine(527)-N(7))-methyltransferase RsmG [Ignavibacteria bacterium]
MLDRKCWFRTVCRQNGVEISDEQIRKLSQYADILLEWNRSINLISRKDEENLWTTHFLHSAAILFRLSLPPHARVLDLGTGGGLPGIPLKILAPDISITLLDSAQKKIKVVADIIKNLGLKRALAVWGRAEDVGRKPDHHKRYDVVVARAVGRLSNLVRWSKPLLRETNRPTEQQAETVRGNAKERIAVKPPALIALKGGDLQGELGSLTGPTGNLFIRVIDLALKGSAELEEGEKKIVLIEFGNTPQEEQRSTF